VIDADELDRLGIGAVSWRGHGPIMARRLTLPATAGGPQPATIRVASATDSNRDTKRLRWR
jgi:hypothetical protein